MITEQPQQMVGTLQQRQAGSTERKEPATIQRRDFTLSCPDGVNLSATLFSPSTPPRGVLILAAAVAVPRRFYRYLAGYFADRGYQVLTFDYRGCGSVPQPESPRLAEWGTLDIDTAINHALTLPGKERVFLMGHSIGGQLVGLAPQADQLKGIVMVAASFPYLKRWPYPRRLLLQLLFNVLVPVIGTVSPVFPCKRLGLGSIDLPSSLIRDWAEWIRRDDYLLDEKFGFSPEWHRRLACPMRVYGFDDDVLVPRASINKLLAAYGSQDVDEHFIAVRQRGLKPVGHTGFFRETHRNTIWKQTLDWLNAIP